MTARLFLGLSLALVTACSTEAPTAETTSARAFDGQATLAFQGPQSCDPSRGTLDDGYPSAPAMAVGIACHTLLESFQAPSGLSSDRVGDVNAAKTEWETALHAGALGLPSFAAGANSRTVTLTAQENTIVNKYDGQWQPGSNADNVNLSPTSGADKSAFKPVLMVELSHLYGYLSGNWEHNDGSSLGVSDHCVREQNGRNYSTNYKLYITTRLCQHEIEGIYAAYGIRRFGFPDRYKHIITGLIGLPARHDTVRLQVDEDTTVAIDSLYFGRANPLWCGTIDSDGTSHCTRPASEAPFVWSAPGGKITLTQGSNSTSQTIRAVAVGTTTVSVAFGSGNPYDVATLIESSYEEYNSPMNFTVVVLPPPQLPEPGYFNINTQGCVVKKGKVTYPLHWADFLDPGDSIVIRHANVDNLSLSDRIYSGPVSPEGIVNATYSMTVPPLIHYWWVRQYPDTTWVQNAAYAQNAADGCIF